MDNNLEETIGAKEAEITGEIFLLISFLLAPFAGFISILCYGLSRLLLDQLKATLLLFFTGVIMIISLTFSIRFPNFKDFPILKAIQDYLLFLLGKSQIEPSSILSLWFKSFNWYILSMTMITQGFGLILLPKSQKEKLKDVRKKEERKHLSSRKSSKVLDMSSKKHLFTAGTTGSGKSANILRYIDDTLKNDGFSVIIDGKGGLGDYDLATVTLKLAKKYNRKVYIINQTDVEQTNAYNPFKGLSATQVKDMLINMSDWESDHYKTLSARYWQVMVDVMLKCHIPISFESLIYFSFKKHLLSLLDEAIKKDLIESELYQLAESLANGESGTQAEISIARSAIVYEGDGQKLFSSQNAFNISKAYEENAIVLVLLNEFNYSDFARSTGKIVIDDIKNLVGQLQKKQQNHQLDGRKILFIFEELGVYVDIGIEGLLNRTRSIGAKVICSVQTTADIDQISPELTRQILGNCNEYMIMRVSDPNSAELISKMIGTNKTIKKTFRTNDKIETGDSSNVLTDSFKISPNEIKNLPDLFGFYYSKSTPNSIKRFKTAFIKI